VDIISVEGGRKKAHGRTKAEGSGEGEGKRKWKRKTRIEKSGNEN
jgi:hypothetical protein